MAATQGKERPMAQKTSKAQQTTGPDAPRANLCLTQGADATPRKLRLARGLGAPSGKFPPRSGPPAPRVRLHLARGTLDPRHCTCSPDQSIKYSDALRVPGSKANPRHAGLLTPLGNQIPVLFDQPALCSHPRCCVGVVREGRCHSVTLCCPLPYLLHVAPLERG
jgi:hypothetical protein